MFLFKNIRRNILGGIRLLKLRLYNSKLTAGRGFFCGKSCHVSRGRTIIIGNNFYMGRGCHLAANMEVGDDVMFASEVAVVGGDHKIDFIDVAIRYSGRDIFKTTYFHKGCWIGHRAIIMHGVTIGEGAVVAAGSVVTKDVEKNTIVAGNPAKYVRHRKF